MNESNTGSTFFDFLSKLIHDFGYALVLLAALSVFLGVWGFAHWSAKECERVSIWWSMVDYVKGGCQPPSVSSPVPQAPPVQLPISQAAPAPNLSPTVITLRQGESHRAEMLTITALFNKIGGESFATLRLTPDNAATVNKPAVGGETFMISTSQGKFSVSVLSLDNAAQSVTLKVNHAE